MAGFSFPQDCPDAPEGSIQSAGRSGAGAYGYGHLEWHGADGRMVWSCDLLAVYGMAEAPCDEAGFLAVVHPEDRDRVRTDVALAFATGAPLDHQFRILQPSGAIRRILARGVAERTADDMILRVVQTDVTTLAPPPPSRSAEAFEQLVASSPFGIYTVDGAFRLRHVSPGARRTFAGIEPLVGRDFAEVMRLLWPEPMAERIIGQFRHTLETGEAYREPSVVAHRIDLNQSESYDWTIERITLSDGCPGVVCQFYDLTERNVYERALRDSEHRFALAQEAAGFGIWEMDFEGGRLSCDAVAQQLYGVPAETRLTDLAPARTAHPADAPCVQDTIRDAMKGGAKLSGEHRILRPDGSARWLSVSGRPVPGEDGRSARRAVGIVSDVTERRERERALRKSLARLEMAYEATGIAYWEVDLTTGRAEWSAQLDVILGLDGAEPPTADLFFRHVHPDDVLRVRERFAQAIATGGIYDEEFRIVRTDGRILYVAGRGRAVMAKDGTPVRMTGVNFDVTTRRTTEEALRASEARLALGVEIAGLALVEADFRSSRVHLSDWAARLYGLGDHGMELPRSALIELVHPEDRDSVLAELARADDPASGGLFEMTHRILRPDGQTRTVRVRRQVLFEGAGPARRPSRAIMAALDVTDELQAAWALRENEARLQLILDGSSAFIGVMDPDGTLREANAAILQAAGVTREAVTGRKVWEAAWFNHDPAVIARVRDSVARAGLGETVRHDAVVRMAGDARLTIDFMLTPVRDADGQVVCLVHSGFDVTERKRAEELLRDSEARFRGVFQYAGTGIVIVDTQRRLISANPALCRMLGYAEKDLVGLTIADIIHPDDLEENEEAIRQVLSGQVPSYETNNRCRTRDGETLWIQKHVSALRDAAGRAVGTIGLFTDISDRKRAEERAQLLMREVNHRSKNMLSLIQAVARQTARSSPRDFLARFDERIQAIAAAQNLLVTNGWQGVSLRELALSQLAHFKDLIGTRVLVDGPDFNITAAAAQTLGMAFHELATNAGKYGALSNDTGRVALGWTIRCEPDSDRELIVLNWEEREGPPVSPPETMGFGTRMIDSLVKSTLDAEVVVDFAPEGLSWRVEADISHVTEKVQARAIQDRPAGGLRRPESASTAPARGRRILVVEDEVVVALDVAMALEALGHVVLGPVATVEQAMRTLDEGGCDAALLDINLGRETSEPVARRLVEAGVPFLTVSAYSGRQQSPVFHRGRYLAKPIDHRRLEAELAAMLEAVPATHSAAGA
nr:PAS domain S-box protein [Rubellimicrobium arenae]